MAFGPQLFMNQGSGLTMGNSQELVTPPQLEQQEFQDNTISNDLQGIVEADREPVKGIQLNDQTLSLQARFVNRRGQEVMANKNPEGFIREGGLVVDNDKVYIDSFEQSQIPLANLRGALIQLVQAGVPSVSIKSFTKDKVVGARELIKKRFRV